MFSAEVIQLLTTDSGLIMKTTGLVDLQVNGYKGTCFSNIAVKKTDVISACDEILATGVSAFLPTVITSHDTTYEHILPIFAEVFSMTRFKETLPGLHIEGPFISMEPGAVGAHNPAWCKKPEIDSLKKLIDLSQGNIKLLTLAPELPGALPLTEFAVSQGIVVSSGHSLALSDTLADFASAGGSAITHFGNGLPNQINRHNNPMWGGLANDDLYAMIITDGHHLPPSIIKSVIRAKGVDKTIVVSDATYLAGCKPGKYSWNGDEVVLEKGGRIFKPSTQSLAGSSMMMPGCIDYLKSLKLLSPQEISAVSCENPRRLIGI